MDKLDLLLGEDKLTENHCKITYRCYSERKKDKCCYQYEDTNLENHCRYQIRNTCNSSVAKVNRLVLELQRLTGKKIRFEDE